jgi:hypothetical protein
VGVIIRLAAALAFLSVPAAAFVTALVRDAETGKPLGGAVCTATGTDVMAVTDQSGGCVVPVSGKAWRVAASAVGYLPDSVGAAAAEKGRVVIGLFRDLPRVVRGRVIEAVSGRALGDAGISVGGSSAVRSAPSGGGFLLSAFPQGEQVVEAAMDGFVSDRLTVLARGNETTEVVLRLKDTSDVGNVGGTVIDEAGGLGIAGAELSVDSSAFVARADSVGQYHIDKLPSGEYWLVCRAGGYAAQKIRFRVLKDWTVGVSFRLRRLGAQ